MQEIEHKIIVEHESPSEYVLQAAREYGWDVDALKAWAEQAIVNSDHSQIQQQFIGDVTEQSDMEGGDTAKASIAEKDGSSTASGLPTPNHVNTMKILFIQAFLALGLVVYYGIFSFRGTDTAYYQSSLISSLVSPFGTILRWYLSRLNGKLKGRWNWFPLGTFLANVTASIISALIVGLSVYFSSYQSTFFQTQQAEWSATRILNGVRIGFTGCLSTVSTLATEFDKINKTFPHHAKAIYYTTSSFLTACILGIVIYAPLVS
jgi:fluoride ion exporter CrcB/FEX